MKLLIAELIEKHGWQGRGISWTTFEAMRTLEQVEDRLESIMREPPRLLAIDEATSVVGWQRVVKKMKDQGRLEKTCVILTGSSAHDLKAGAERMAGRRGDVSRPDRVLLPMSFLDFRAQRERAFPGSIADDEVLFRDFLVCGGFPFRVERAMRTRGEGREFAADAGAEIFDDVFFYEINRRRLDRNVALEILGRLAAVQCSAVSYQGFVKPLTCSRETARRYLDALGDAFLLASVSSYDTARGRVAPKKDRKFVWIDPALACLPYFMRQGEAPRDASLVEGYVGANLLRREEARLFEGLSAPRNVFTWKSQSGKEVDFLVVDKSRGVRFPVEVKYQRSIADWDFMVIEQAFGQGWLVTTGDSRRRKRASAFPAWQLEREAVGRDLRT